MDGEGIIINRDPVKYKILPPKSQEILVVHFPREVIATVEKEDDGEYEVKLQNGVEIEFDSNGEWEEIDGHRGVIPATFILEVVKKNSCKYLSDCSYRKN